jgi:hypothetical protein
MPVSSLDKIVNEKRLFVEQFGSSDVPGEGIEAMNILSFFRLTKSKYVDDKSVDDFERVLKQTKPSAFDVAMEETRQSEDDAWAKMERDLKQGQ